MFSTESPAATAALAGLIDYAGLFPPAALPMEAARTQYVAARGLPHGWMLGRFVTPLSRLDELGGESMGEPIPVSAILDARTEPLRWFGAAVELLEATASTRTNGRTRIQSVEAALPALLSTRENYGSAIGQLAALVARHGLGDLPTYVELPRDARWEASLPDAMTSLARHGLRAKVRCGGTVAAAFPSCHEVAAFIVTAVRAGVPFRATAGLHHPIRHFDAQLGTSMHGFLNILAATLLALDDQGPRVVEAALEQEDATQFVFEADAFSFESHRFDAAALTDARRQAFVAYGSCSFDEPVADLIGLGMLTQAVVR